MEEGFTPTLLNTINTSMDNGFFVYSDDIYRMYYRIYIPDLLLIEYDDPLTFGGGGTLTETAHQHTIVRLLDKTLLDDYGLFAQLGPKTIHHHYANADHHHGDPNLVAINLLFNKHY